MGIQIQTWIAQALRSVDHLVHWLADSLAGQARNKKNKNKNRNKYKDENKSEKKTK